jgi:hypothetical protein
MLYVRVIPMAGNQPAGPPSNTVDIEYGPSEPPTIEPVIMDHLPNQYHVAISSFTLETVPSFATWGCVYIDELPDLQVMEDYYVAQAASMVPDLPFGRDAILAQLADQARAQARFDYAIWQAHMDSGQILCPATYVQPDDDQFVLLEAFSAGWDTLKSAWNEAVNLFNSLKAGIIDIVAEVLNRLGIPCDGTCKGLLMTGLELVISVYTGIPPSLPNFDELTDMGIDYAIEYAAAEAGVPCPDELKEALRDELKGVAEGTVSSTGQSQPACQDQSYTRQAWLKEPLCLPPGVVTTPAYGSMYEPAMAVLTVWNPGEIPPQPIAYAYDGQPAYAVKLSVTATNREYAGKTFRYPYIVPGHSASIVPGLLESEEEEETFVLDVPIAGEISGPVYETEVIAIPPLRPGEQVEIPIILRPTRHVLAEHWSALESALQGMGLSVDDVRVPAEGEYGRFEGAKAVYYGYGRQDRDCLLHGAFVKAEAEVMCLSVEPSLAGQLKPGPDSVLVPCGFEALPVQKRDATPACYIP